MQNGFRQEKGFQHLTHKFILWSPLTELVILC
jgi:hypothetical protein